MASETTSSTLSELYTEIVAEALFVASERSVMRPLVKNYAITGGGKAVEVPIKEGEIFLLPPKVPHSPRRSDGSIGLVIEVKRKEGEMDGLQWYCENCNHQLHSVMFKLNNVEKDFQPRFKEFYGSQELRTCDNCGAEMETDERFI